MCQHVRVLFNFQRCVRCSELNLLDRISFLLRLQCTGCNKVVVFCSHRACQHFLMYSIEMAQLLIEQMRASIRPVSLDIRRPIIAGHFAEWRRVNSPRCRLCSSAAKSAVSHLLYDMKHTAVQIFSAEIGKPAEKVLRDCEKQKNSKNRHYV